mgnify:FL=1
MENENETVENLFENDVQNDNEVSNAFVDLPPVAPVDYTEEVNNNSDLNYENVVENNEQIVQPETTFVNYEDATINESTNQEENKEYVAKEVLENPNAKVVLNQEKEEEISSKEMNELKDVKLSDNNSLKFVLILGVIFLIAIFIIPVLSKYI